MNLAKLGRLALRGLALLLLLLAAALLAVRCMYGGGRPYPDTGTPPLLPDARLTVLAELEMPPGNVTSAPDGRIFFNLHPFAEPWRFTDATVFELVDGAPRPYPSAALQGELRGVLGMTADRQGRLWMVLPSGLEDRPTRLLGFDLATDALVVDHAFTDIAAPFAQDLRVAPDGATVYLADTGILRFTPPALIVFDVAGRTARRVLEGHPSVTPQDWQIHTADGPYTLGHGLVTFAVGVDGLAVGHDGAWLYYATMTHDSVYRVRTRDLRDPALPADALGERVERVGPKPLSDGIEIDAAGNLYITDVEHGAVARLTPAGELRTLVRSDEIVWSDGVALTAGGELLLTDSEIPAYIDPLLRAPTRARIDAAAPHRIYRVALPPAAP
jgi:hypothetical protein